MTFFVFCFKFISMLIHIMVFIVHIQIMGDGNCMFNDVLEQIQFDSDEDESWYTAKRLRIQIIAFFCMQKVF